MMNDYPRVRLHASLEAERRVLQREVIRLVLHLPFGHRELAVRVRHALDKYLRNTGLGPDFFIQYAVGDEPRALDAEGWTDIRDTLIPPPQEFFLDDETDESFLKQKLKEQFDRTVELSVSATGVTGYGFFYWARLPWRTPEPQQVSLVSFSWPTEYLEAHGAERTRAEIMDLVALLPHASGHAGLALSSPNLWGPSLQGFDTEALRYPGMDVTHGQRDLGSRVDGVHWLNFLNAEVVTQVGGSRRSALSSTSRPPPSSHLETDKPWSLSDRPPKRGTCTGARHCRPTVSWRACSNRGFSPSPNTRPGAAVPPARPTAGGAAFSIEKGA